MSQKNFIGYGETFEVALTAAAEQALASWKPAGPDDMAKIRVESTDILYGGIVGHVGTRVVSVSMTSQGALVATAAAAPHLNLKLDVMPDSVYANLMPPVRRPQPHSIGIVFNVSNTGTAPFNGQSRDSALVQFTVLRGRTAIWRWPEIVNEVVTPILIPPGTSRSFTATWEMADAVEFVHADLHVVARFVPSGESAMHPIEIKPVY